MQVIAYGPLEFTESPVRDLDLLRQMRGKWPVLWVNVDGVAHAPTLAAIGEIFGLHRLALEDLGDVHQRAKVEAYGDDHLFVLVRMARLAPELDLEQVMPPRDAFFGETEQVADPVGRVAAEMISPYPPGVPAILPGERFNQAVVAYLRAGKAAGMTIPDSSDPDLNTFRIVRNG